MNYEIIVVGGGHAGCEAAYASAYAGNKTLLVTSNISNIADMPCNPSIGGSAKGIVVREIDALGGIMGKVANKAQIQIKMLNGKKGPAIRALRAQADKIIYPKEMLRRLNELKTLTITENFVDSLIVNDNEAFGVITDDGERITSKAVILTTGTYMKSEILLGESRTSAGPHGEKTSSKLSENLKENGFELLRLKTGTPQRILKQSVNYSLLKEEYGDPDHLSFSFDEQPDYDFTEQLPCYLIYTNSNTHQIINDNITKSSMYGAIKNIESVGPRYCPSIEDKIIRFSDKERHQLFLEPESKESDELYLQGFSTSMPCDIQDKMVHSLSGLENAIISKYGYAIEYDAIVPTQLWPNLETKIIKNLFTAGQINGTSGYEEAAGQGLIAGINASQSIKGEEPLILGRDKSYIGVLIDDLVTKGTMEPYRLLTSRAEYRLLLRHDNADIRLREYGYKYGLIDENRYQLFITKKNLVNSKISEYKETFVKPNEINSFLDDYNSTRVKDRISISQLIKRPELKLKNLEPFVKLNFSKEIMDQIEINIKYEGYIEKTLKEVKRMEKLEKKQIPQSINYSDVKNIATEALMKLTKIKPLTLGQASRISGVNPSDIAVLSVYIKSLGGKND